MCIQGAAVPLSTDHTADREDERLRIVQAGGHVSHVLGNWRIGQAGIQVSRSGFSLCRDLHIMMCSAEMRASWTQDGMLRASVHASDDVSCLLKLFVGAVEECSRAAPQLSAVSIMHSVADTGVSGITT